jgi:hypothetical protein
VQCIQPSNSDFLPLSRGHIRQITSPNGGRETQKSSPPNSFITTAPRVTRGSFSMGFFGGYENPRRVGGFAPDGV